MPKSKSSKESGLERREKEKSDRGVHFPPGFINHGNTCFMNSVLQGLIATPYLQQMIQMRLPQSRLSPALTNGRGQPYEQDWTDGMRLADIFIIVMQKAWRVKDTQQWASLSPKEILTTLGKKYDQYNDFRQQDAHEFLRLLLDAMRMEEFDVIKKRQPPPEKGKKGSREPAGRDVPQEDRLVSFVDSVFGGELASILICETCKHVSVTNEPFDDLSLSIKQEDTKDRKRDRFRQVVQKLLLADIAPPRPQSVPPPETGYGQRGVTPAHNTDSRRLSLEREPGSIHISAPIAPSRPTVAEEPSEKLGAKIGRRVSVALRRRRGKEREESGSGPGDDDTEAEEIRSSRPSLKSSPNSDHSRSPSPNPKKTQQAKKALAEAAYLRSLLSDIQRDRPLNPFSYLPPGSGLWSKLAPSQGLENCLRQFTAVELLDGENAVGCRRCWKIANGLYHPKETDHDEDEAAAEDEVDKPAPTYASSVSVSPASTGVISPRPDMNISTLDLTSSVSSLPPSYVSSEHTQRLEPIQIPEITTEPPRSPSPIADNDGGRPLIARSFSESAAAPDQQHRLKAPEVHYKRGRPRSTLAYDNDSASGHSSDENSGDESVSQSNGQPPDSGLKPKRRHKPKEVLMRRAYKRYLIAKPPPVLVIHLKRFQQVSKNPSAFFGNLKKLDDYIQFPEYLDLSGFLAPNPEEFGLSRGRGTAASSTKHESAEEMSTYRLVAVVVHIGNMLGGHYVAYTALPSPQSSTPESEPEPKAEPADGSPIRSPKAESRQWCFISDTVVRLATLEEVLKSKAYLCFYERIDTAPHRPRL